MKIIKILTLFNKSEISLCLEALYAAILETLLLESKDEIASGIARKGDACVLSKERPSAGDWEKTKCLITKEVIN